MVDRLKTHLSPVAMEKCTEDLKMFEKQDGRQLFGFFFREKHWENSRKKRATKNCWWTGETEISLVLLYGVYIFSTTTVMYV